MGALSVGADLLLTVDSYQLSSRVQQAESAEKTENVSMMDVKTCLNEHKQVSYVRLTPSIQILLLILWL